MDERVLEAQKWVNATYRTVSGYAPCPENGKTGWTTMYSLIMGLQKELGINPVVASFGPTTMSKLQALGDISSASNTNKNIIRILQHGLFCKGYIGGYEYGLFGNSTSNSIAQLRNDMGISTGTSVNAKIFRCILNMDAYIVLQGGSDKVRDIQRWLNCRYWLRDAFTLGPCDGHYSRDVQRSLMVALQYELGISAPNGNFGPATQSALRTRTVRPGATGIFVELFSSACVFNEPVPFNGQTVVTTKRTSFDGALAEFVQVFQSFSELAVSGIGDYATWAQLLVSMGDPDRPVTGCDTRFEITATRAAWLKNSGYKAIGRYIYDPPGSTLDKELKPGEIATIFGAGLRVMPIYQDNARLLTDFTYSQGYEHGNRAHDLATGYGFNRGTVIYFAVDYDATQEDIDSSIIPYFQGIQSALAQKGKKYLHGVYGSRNVCINVTEKTFARFSFVSGMSWGFSGNLGYPLPSNWSFNQIKEQAISTNGDSFDLDNNVWRSQLGDPGQSAVDSVADIASVFIKYIQDLYDCAVRFGKGDPNRLVTDFVRSKSYAGPDWTILISSIQYDFVLYARDNGFSIMTEFVDPASGYSLGAEHLMASLEGHRFHKKPTNPKTVNEGDVTGWGGDLLTFYRDWMNSENYPSGYAFCQERLANPNVISSFGFADLIEDADAFLITQRMEAGVNIATAVREHYSTDVGIKRFSAFFKGRFTDSTTCLDLAHNILTAVDNPTVSLARIGLIQAAIPPATLPFDKLRGFEQGFVDVLVSRVNAEPR